MKKIISLALIAASLLSLTAIEAGSSRDEQGFKRSKNNPCNPRVITQSQFGPDASTPVVISEPGYYIICKDLFFNPLPGSTPGLRINASDVVLDFCNHTFRQQQGAAFIPVIGVEVQQGIHTNIEIRNGTIRDFNATGLFVRGGNQAVRIKNMSIVNNALNTGVNVDAHSCVLTEVNINAARLGGEAGICVVGVPGIRAGDVIIENCQLHANRGKNLFIRFADGVTVTNVSHNGATNMLSDPSLICTQIPPICNPNSAASLATAVIEVTGAFVDSATKITFNSCTFYENSDPIAHSAVGKVGNNLVAGAWVQNSKQVVFKKCNAFRNGVQNNPATTNIVTYGFGSAGDGLGSTSDILYEDCSSDNNIGVVAGVGFDTCYTQKVVCRNCVASSNAAGIVAPATPGTAAGFRAHDGNPASSTFVNDHIFDACIAENNDGFGGVNPSGFGFMLSGQNGSVITNNLSKGNNWHGIIVQNGSKCCTVKGNTITNNSGLGIFEPDGSTSVYANNFAFANKTTLVTPNSNYSITPAVGCGSAFPIAKGLPGDSITSTQLLVNLDILPCC